MVIATWKWEGLWDYYRQNFRSTVTTDLYATTQWKRKRKKEGVREGFASKLAACEKVVRSSAGREGGEGSTSEVNITRCMATTGLNHDGNVG
jgi:hypothetical protein